jgi:hypothetical protein
MPPHHRRSDQNDLSELQGDEKTQARKERMKKRGFLDDEERELITEYESGEFRPVKDRQTAKLTAVQAASRYLRKDAQV